MLYIYFISLILTVVLLLQFIPKLIELKFGQIVREEGPLGHYIKTGTPTMGGITFILGTLITALLFSLIKGFDSEDYKIMLLFFLPMFFYGILGFVDDYLIVVKKNNIGIKPNVKFFLQILLSVIYFYIYLSFDMSTLLQIGNFDIDLIWVYGILILLMFTSTTNAVNLTDGLDGLATGLVIIALLAFLTIMLDKDSVLSLCVISLIGSLSAFLLFNRHPAKIFMGDTGSLALGAVLVTISIIMKKEILLIIIGAVFVIETLSVILQVSYFKITKGKRIFKMAPLHHHFELKGIKEYHVVELFWIAGFLFGLLGLYLNGNVL
ncbi:phospho-N-acetylmuramoyl-pentapeptide-transferase [Mycoplasmatota bacterium WC44]